MATTETSILQGILDELRISKRTTSWPDHPVAQAGLVANASGMLLNASIDYKYNRAKRQEDIIGQRLRMRKEAIETAVNAIRFLENLKVYETSIIKLSDGVHPEELSQDVYQEHSGDIKDEFGHSE